MPEAKPSTLWHRIAQGLVGLFFATAAFYKLTDSFFGHSGAPLGGVFTFWLDSNFPVSWYRPVLQWWQPHADVLAVFIILIQAVVGILFLYNARIRLAAALLFFLHLNMLLGTLHGWGFWVFQGIGLWMAAFFWFRDSMTPRLWALLTWSLFILHIAFLWGRATRGDPWTASFSWGYANFQRDVMSVSPALKQLVMTIADTSMGPKLWAGVWWLQAGMTILLFTRWRLWAGMLWLLIVFARVTVWTTAIAGEGTLWVLTVLVWLTYEDAWQRSSGVVPLLPGRGTMQRMWQLVARWWQASPASFPPVVGKKQAGIPRAVYSVIFGVLVLCVIVTMALPRLFGLQSLTQWGGMYTDAWCNATLYSASPDTSGVQSKWHTVGTGPETTAAVWSAPMHSQDTCAIWFKKMLCGQKVSEGWTVEWVVPQYKHEKYLGDANACDIKTDPRYDWFRHVNQ